MKGGSEDTKRVVSDVVCVPRGLIVLCRFSLDYSFCTTSCPRSKAHMESRRILSFINVVWTSVSGVSQHGCCCCSVGSGSLR